MTAMADPVGLQRRSLASSRQDGQAADVGSASDASVLLPRQDRRVLVAAHFVRAGAVGGAEHMLYNLLAGLGSLGVDLTVACSATGQLDPAALALLKAQPNTRVVATGDAGSRFLAEQLAALRRDLAADAVIFPNYFVPPILPARLGRVVGVLHDLQYRHYPQHFSQRKRVWLRGAHALAAARADRIVVISEFARADTVRWLGSRVERKLAVIPNPISWERFDTPPMYPAKLDRPYILSVAAQYPHKNLRTLLRAFAHVTSRDRDLQLVLCGQTPGALRGIGGPHEGIAQFVEELGISDRVILTGYVDDAALGNWYRHARVFAFPSIFEGFGMPPVEALGFGIPVLTTNLTAIPETTLGLAHYVQDAMDPSEWASLISAAAADPAAYSPSPEAVARLRSHYRPERVARSYLDLCGEA